MFLLDDHEVVRRGIAATLEAEEDMTVVGEAASAADAVAEVRRSEPDVAVLNVRLEDGTGIDVCREISSEFDQVRTPCFGQFEQCFPVELSKKDWILLVVRGREGIAKARNEADTLA